MQIVPQSAPFSYSPFSVSPFLLLPAPRIAGLLPARVPERPAQSPQVPIFRAGLAPGQELIPKRKPGAWRDLPKLPSIEEMDAEIEEYLQAGRVEFAAFREARHARYAQARAGLTEGKS